MSGDGDHALSFIYLIGVLVLVVSALMVRRIPIGQGLKMAVGWVLIFGAAFAAFALKDDFVALGKRVMEEGGGEGRVVQQGRELRVKKAEDGHFWVAARVNGERVQFLIDSGATTTSLSAGTAKRVGVVETPGDRAMVNTANGIVTAKRGRIDRLTVGTIERRNVAVHFSEAFDDMDVLGMNFLSTLSRWGVEGNWLVLTP